MSNTHDCLYNTDHPIDTVNGILENLARLLEEGSSRFLIFVNCLPGFFAYDDPICQTAVAYCLYQPSTDSQDEECKLGKHPMKMVDPENIQPGKVSSGKNMPPLPTMRGQYLRSCDRRSLHRGRRRSRNGVRHPGTQGRTHCRHRSLRDRQ